MLRAEDGTQKGVGNSTVKLTDLFPRGRKKKHTSLEGGQKAITK